ncbi:uncharacterized protein LOC131319622 isoform X1 [Rhododendron vialii]|uniref:uncharacterized protein LOC131319622 isoform X1 n=1 Tax=Rhododendron vialii TaxID=182163 RepID=UPI00265FE9D5|nr:uncharacterized protein LOC131319622 isoform X1 [Rhododendron vialii]
MDVSQDYWRSHVPAFGSWDCADDHDLPFTQCFDSARQPGLVHYSYPELDRDLYVAGDLYENDVVTPAMIVVPRRREKAGYPHVKEAEKEEWAACDVKEPPSPVGPPPRKAPKPVDEDLYRISPELLRAKSKRKRGCGFFSSCLQPSCDS